MKRFLILLSALTLLLTGCAAGPDLTQPGFSPLPEEVSEGADDEYSPGSDTSGPPVADLEEEITEEHHWDLIPMVMVDGQLYYDTGRRNDEVLRCGVMDGEITSSVEGWEVPSKDNQSNFGSGYGWQWGSTEGEIEVNIEDHWLVFETRPGDGSTAAAEE